MDNYDLEFKIGYYLAMCSVCAIMVFLLIGFHQSKNNNDFCISKGFDGADNKNKGLETKNSGLVYPNGYLGCYKLICNNKSVCVKEYVGVKGD